MTICQFVPSTNTAPINPPNAFGVNVIEPEIQITVKSSLSQVVKFSEIKNAVHATNQELGPNTTIEWPIRANLNSALQRNDATLQITRDELSEILLMRRLILRNFQMIQVWSSDTNVTDIIFDKSAGSH